MIKLSINNGQEILIEQTKKDENIAVKFIDSKGNIENDISISAGDMVMLLNYYQFHKNKGISDWIR